MRLADGLDILIIATLLYYSILWLRLRASRPLIVGIGIIGLCYICAHRFGMYLTASLFQVGFTAVLLAIVIVFQSDIRRSVERFATWSSSGGNKHSLASSQTIDTIIETVHRLAENSIGALLVLKGREPIERHIRGGVSLNGRISFPLLYGIFDTHSPTHDGAVIIEGERIDRFATYLPLSRNLKEGREAGTRHEAGRGLSEVCDALVIVVSEERGTISVAEQGNLEVLGSAAQLKERLDNFYRSMRPQIDPPIKFTWLKHNFLLKLISLLVAVGLWIFFAHRVETIHRTYTVPIEWRGLPANFVVDSIRPVEARISLSGNERDFNFDPSAMIISLDLAAVRDGTQEVLVSEWSLMNKPLKVMVTKIEPQTIRVKAYAMAAVELPIKINMENKLPDDLRLIRTVADPPKIKIMVPRNRTREYTQVSTEPVDLEEISQCTSKWLKLVLPHSARLPEGALSTIKVDIEVAPAVTGKTPKQPASR
jgi:diadenylate cyclase